MNGHGVLKKFGLLSRVNIPIRIVLRLLIYSMRTLPVFISSSKVAFSLVWRCFQLTRDLRSDGSGWLPGNMFGEIFECQVEIHKGKVQGSISYACHELVMWGGGLSVIQLLLGPSKELHSWSSHKSHLQNRHTMIVTSDWLVRVSKCLCDPGIKDAFCKGGSIGRF